MYPLDNTFANAFVSVNLKPLQDEYNKASSLRTYKTRLVHG